MKHKLLLACSTLSLALSSCYYDPYATNVSYSVGFSSGGGFGSSVFVSTGDPRWAYDPTLYCYFDRTRRCYYDPFLFGYYPVGYIPVGIRGCPHPYGWSGSGICPYPRSVNSRYLSRYDQRLSNYASAEYHWARRVSASGSPRWLGSSERERLYERASAVNQPSRVSGWMDSRGLSGQQSSLRQQPSSTFFNNESRSFNTRSSAMRSPSVRESAPRIEQRPAPGGMFGGLERTRSTSVGNGGASGLRQVRQTPAPPVQRSTSRESRYTPREESSERESSSSGMRGGLERYSGSSSSRSYGGDSGGSSSSYGRGSSERSSGGGGERSGGGGGLRSFR